MQLPGLRLERSVTRIFCNPLKTRNLQRFLEVSNWVQGLDLNQPRRRSRDNICPSKARQKIPRQFAK